MKKELLEKINSRGYWRINFRPVAYNHNILSLSECKTIVEKCHFDFRGWPYPYFPTIGDASHDLEPAQDYYLGWVDWSNHIEFWHMYQSGQFLHYLALREDWYEDSIWAEYTKDQIRKEGPLLGVTLTVFQITEIFEFLSRLCQERIYEEGLEVFIDLKNTKGRKLWVSSPGRVPFHSEYRASEDLLKFESKYLKDNILINYKEIAINVVLHFFERFGWHTPNMDTIIKDQQDFFLRKV
jgi:hypothetical protein